MQLLNTTDRLIDIRKLRAEVEGHGWTNEGRFTFKSGSCQLSENGEWEVEFVFCFFISLNSIKLRMTRI